MGEAPRQLNALDYLILNELYTEGLSIKDVKEKHNTIAPGYISQLLRHPNVQEFVEDQELEVAAEMAGLRKGAINAIRENLTHDTADVQLRAADKVLKASGMYREKIEVEHTAEDAIKDLLSGRGSNSPKEAVEEGDDGEAG